MDLNTNVLYSIYSISSEYPLKNDAVCTEFLGCTHLAQTHTAATITQPMNPSCILPGNGPIIRQRAGQ